MVATQTTWQPAQARPADEDTLVGRLVEEMSLRWASGERPLTDEFLDRHPELRNHPRAVLRLLDQELALHQQYRVELSTARLVKRFPGWRSDVEALLNHRQTAVHGPTTSFPTVGEKLGDYQLIAPLGCGAAATVFLAVQPGLADRPVVLKITPCQGQEHRALARLQHAHIVPLYTAHDLPSRDLRLLCMPYFGGTTLAALFKALSGIAPEERSGRALLDALNRVEEILPARPLQPSPAQLFLGRATYVQAVCWIGACLAEALQFAHQHGIVHLDLKPSNVLLTAEGQPMLLDFHLAQEPLRPGGPVPEWTGGTVPYMSPEQHHAVRCLTAGQPIPVAVDGRSDIYSLGVLLYEALVGKPWREATPAPRLDKRNAAVGVEVADVVHKCLARDPAGRYANAGDLADDLRRALANRSLIGVRNRRRQSLAGAALTLLACASLLFGGWLTWRDIQQHTRAAEVVRAHERDLQRARREQRIRDLHPLVNRLRFRLDVASLSTAEAERLERSCRAYWEMRDQLRRYLADDLEGEAREEFRSDLLDLVIVWTELRVRLAAADARPDAHRAALQTLQEAETLFGPSVVLYRERQHHAKALGLNELAAEDARRAAALPPRSAWEHYALGRCFYSANQTERAAEEFASAVRADPQAFWPNFALGLCALRQQQSGKAVEAFSTCIGCAASKPELARCYYNRAVAQTALGDNALAMADYTAALELDATLTEARLNRGTLYCRLKRFDEAVADFQRVLKEGHEPATAYYNLAVVANAQQDRRAARDYVEKALKHDPAHKGALALRQQLDSAP